MTSYYTFRVSWSDITVPEKSKSPYLYVKISFRDESCRTRSVNGSSPQWNEIFPITCSDKETRFTIELMKESMVDTSIGSVECTFEDILSENGEEICLFLQSKSGIQHLIFLCLQPSDETRNAEITLMNLARILLDTYPSSEDSFVENVNSVFNVAKSTIKSDACQSLVNMGYKITAFVEFGNSIADASPYLKLAWCMTTAFLYIIATQTKTDKRVKDLVKNLLNLFLINKETSVFANPSESLLSVVTELLGFITQCSTLLQDYTRKGFIVRAILHDKKAALDDLENTLVSLKVDLMSAFERQGIIEAEIRALREELEKKLQPKHEVGRERRRCLEGTRAELLKEVEGWVQNRSAPNVFFILGHAGTGKSTVATTVAETCRGSRLGSHLYFMRGRSNPAFIIRTIAYGLAKQDRAVARAVKAQLDEHEIDSFTPDKTFEVLLYEPLHAVTKKEGMKTNVLTILDALDECGNRESRGPYIRTIKEKLQTLPPNYRFLITSRPEEDIASSLELEQLGIRNRWLDHTSNDAKKDILLYIDTELGRLRKTGRIVVEPNWPWEESMNILGSAAGGLFIWASTAVRLIESKRGNMGGELKRLVNTKSLSLGELYATAFEESLSWDEDMKRDFSRIFSLIMFGKEQLSDTEINDLLRLDCGKTRGILNSLRSIVAFEPSQPIRLYHTSLYDYLISVRGKAWFIEEAREKTCLALQCFESMEELRFNICDLETSYKLNKDVPGLEERLESFAFNRLLHWVEVLSLTGSLYIFLSHSLENAIAWIGNKHAQLSAFLQDAHAQLFRFIEPISQSSPHLYMSFLPLMKEDSIVAEHYAKRAQSLTRVEYAGNKPRMACTKQINIGKQVFSVSYSPDGKRIAAGLAGGGISVWDVVSGRRLLCLIPEVMGAIVRVAYSADGRYIASVPGDNTIRVFDAISGGEIYSPLDGHSEMVASVAFHGDGNYIASGSHDNTIRLWLAESGTPIGEPLRGHSKGVKSVVFSPNGCYLASGSEDCTIIVWNVENRKMISAPFKGHSRTVSSLSFSPDSNKIASGSWDGTIRIWEVSSGKILHTFSKDGIGTVQSVAFSSDGKRILSGTKDSMIRMWNAEDCNTSPTRFEGHTGLVWSVSFAPYGRHLASGSGDGTIRVWDIEKGVARSESEPESEFWGQTGAISAIAISPKTGRFLVSSSRDDSVCVWDTESGDLIKGPLKQFDLVESIAFSPDENHFATVYAESIRVWNISDNGLNTYKSRSLSVAFSPDGKHLASGSRDESIYVWNVESGSLATKPFIGHTGGVYLVCYSPDGRKIVSGSTDQTVRSWNASNGDPLSTFDVHAGHVYSITHFNDGLYAVSRNKNKTIGVWNIETGQAEYRPIRRHTVRAESISFSPDGKWIISRGSWDQTVCVWDASTGDLFFQSRVSSKVNCVASFPSSDNKHIKFASSSEDGTIHLQSVDVESEGEEWRLEDNGWLTGINDKLLMWIPPDLRHSLVYGPRILNTHFSTSLDSSLYRGDQWTACFPPDIALA